MISKMKRPEEGGARLAIVFNGSPLFTGAAGSGESEIRRWIIENDWLEAVVALPDQLFYNTGISTYFWVVTNRKKPQTPRQNTTHRRPPDVDQNAKKPRQQTQSKSTKNKSPNSPASTAPSKKTQGCKILPNESFGFLRITVERPLRLRWEITDDTLAAVSADKKVTNLPRPEARTAPRQTPRPTRAPPTTTEKTAKAVVRDAFVGDQSATNPPR